MSLVNRVSAFFLAALAIALVGYSATLYLLVRNHLYGQFDGGLQNALRILAASVEVEFDDAKWQPTEFAVDLDDLRDVAWIVSDEQGQMIDHSTGVSRSDPNYRLILDYSSGSHLHALEPTNMGQWRILQRQLDAPTPKPAALREAHEYAGIRITVARSPVRLQAQMRQLAMLVCVLPVALWLAAATAGRWYFRQALQPLRAMAARARSMKEADFQLRLPVAASDDELADVGIAFNNLLDQLQTAFDREHRFTGNAAHQLRTPLTVLQGQIDVALRRPRKSGEYRQTLQVLSEQVTELRQIVSSLLYLARVEESASPPDLAKLAVDPWLTKYAHRWDDHPRSGDLAVRTSAGVSLMASAPLLAQLMDNLVGNAFKYSEPGTPVQLEAHVEGANVVISVEDRGVGIEKADQTRIFEPFFRAQPVRQAAIPGTGLGLSVAARIASALGGSLECDSTPGRGSTFRVLLPFVPLESSDAPLPQPAFSE